MFRDLQALGRARRAASPLAVGALLALLPQTVAPAHEVRRLGAMERAHFARAVDAFRGGDWRRAAREFAGVARRRGLLTDYAQFFLAEALARRGDLGAARRTARALPDRHPTSRLAPLALLQASALASRQGDEPAAERLLRRFLKQFAAHPEAPAARYLLGLSLEAQGQTARAARAFRRLWLSAPASDYARAAGDRLERLARAGVPVPPSSADEKVGRAEGLLDGGLRVEALAEAEALLAGLPSPALTLRGLSVARGAWQRGGPYAVAERAAEQALAKVPAEQRAPLLLAWARLQRRAGVSAEALETLARLVQQHPRAAEVPEALLESGRILEDAGRSTEADEQYRRLVSDFTDHAAVRLGLWRLGWLAYLRSDFELAAKDWSRLGALPAAGGYRYPAAYWAARALEAIGEDVKARQIFDLLVSESPRSYYGMLASQRIHGWTAASGNSGTVTFPADPFSPLAADERFAKARALSSLGLRHFAVEELQEILIRSLAEPAKLYGLAAAFTREERYHLALRILRRFFGHLADREDPALPRAFWEMFYPFGWQQEIEEAAARRGIDRFLVAALVREESSFFPEARSPAGARGLMQLMPATAQELAERLGLAMNDSDLLEDPVPNLRLGTAYFAWLLGEFPDPRLATAAYNAGPARVREWWAARMNDDLELFVELIPFSETRLFVKHVAVSWQEYGRIYGGSRAADWEFAP